MISPNDKLIIIWKKEGELNKRLKELEKLINNSKKEGKKLKSLPCQFTSVQIIDNKKEFDRLQVNEGDLITVLAELDWKGKFIQDFYGIDLIGKIRFEKGCDVPVALTSILSLTQIKKITRDCPIYREIGNMNFFNYDPFDIQDIFCRKYHLSIRETHRRIINHLDKREKSNMQFHSHQRDLFSNLLSLIFSIERYKEGNKKERYSISEILNLKERVVIHLHLLIKCTINYRDFVPNKIACNIVLIESCASELRSLYLSKNVKDLRVLDEIFKELKKLRVPLLSILQNLNSIRKKI